MNRFLPLFLMILLSGNIALAQTSNTLPPAEQLGSMEGVNSGVQDFQRTAPPEITPSVSIEPPADSATANSSETNDSNKNEMDKINATNAELDKQSGQSAPTPDSPKAKTPPVDSIGKAFLRMILSLAIVLALLFLVAYGLKRMGKTTSTIAGTHLGQIMGKLYLSPKVCLHYVRTGGKVLVIGVTPNTISPLTEFEAETFDTYAAIPVNNAEKPATVAEKGERFVTQLMTHLQQHRSKAGESSEKKTLSHAESDIPEDQELLALRNEIQSLRRFLDESSRDTTV